MYTGTLRESPTGTHYSWSVKAFKRWKKTLHHLYYQSYGVRLREDLPISHEREELYKKLLGMSHVDVFEHHTHSAPQENPHIKAEIFERASQVAHILYSQK